MWFPEIQYMSYHTLGAFSCSTPHKCVLDITYNVSLKGASGVVLYTVYHWC